MRKSTLSTLSLTMVVLFMASLTGSLHSTAVRIPALVDACDAISDANGDLLVWGCYTNDLDFGSVVLSSPEAFSGFVAKLSTSGKWLWVKDFPAAHPYQMMVRGMMIWLERDGCIGVSGPFAWDSPFGKRIADENSNQVSLAYLSPEGELLALDDNFLRNRKKPQRPDYDPNVENNRIETIDNGDFRYSVDNDSDPLIIRCQNLLNGSSWELEFQVSPVLDSSVRLSEMTALNGGGIAFVGYFTCDRLQLGGSIIHNKSSNFPHFIGGIKSDGSGAWIKQLESLGEDFPIFEIFPTQDGGVILSEQHQWMFYSADEILQIEHHFQCFDASGNLLWTVNLGKHFDGRGFLSEGWDSFNFMMGKGGTYLLSAGYLGPEGFIPESRLLQLGEGGEVINRFSLPGTQVGIYVAANFLPNGDLIYCSLTRDNDRYRYTISSLDQNMKLKWEKVLVGESFDPSVNSETFVVVENNIFLATGFS